MGMKGAAENRGFVKVPDCPEGRNEKMRRTYKYAVKDREERAALINVVPKNVAR